MNGADVENIFLNISLIIQTFKNSWPIEDWKRNGFFQEEYIYEINLYWLIFAPPNDSSFTILAILYIAVMAIGITGNFLVIFLYIRSKTLHTPGNALIANLAVSDMLMMLKMPIYIFNSFHKGPALGDIVCRLYGFIGGLTGTVSIVTLATISLDRYSAIKFPLSGKSSKLRIRICLIASWTYGLLFSIIPLVNIGLGKYQYEGYLTSCSFDYLTNSKPERMFILCFFFAAWAVPFVLIAFSYLNILQVVSTRSFSRGNDKDSFRHIKERDKRKQEIKIAVTVFGVIILWFVSWTPYAIIALMGISGKKNLITPFGSMIPALLCKMASCLDPFLYALSHPKFKQELKSCLFGYSARPKEHKIWSTDKTTSKENRHEIREASDVEEDVIEIDLKSIPIHHNVISNIQRERNLDSHEKKLKRDHFYSQLLCLQPNFSNRSSSFRKITRKWSLLKKDRDTNLN